MDKEQRRSFQLKTSPLAICGWVFNNYFLVANA